MTSQTTLLSSRVLAALTGLLVLAGCSDKATPESRVVQQLLARSTQALTAGCGNGVLEPELTETCDDGNIADSDGCSATCTVENGFVCVGERPSVCTAPDHSDAPASYGYAQHARALPPVSPFSGRDFWTGFINNQYGGAGLALKIAGTPGTTGQVTDYAGVVLSTFTIPAGGVSTVSFANSYNISEYGVVRNLGVHVTANAEVRVLATNEGTYSTDSWGVWATEKLGLDHIILDANSSTNGFQFLVVGTAANTNVVIKNAAGVQQAAVTLGQGQTYQVSGSSTLIGYTVTANNPIAVVSGNSCTNDVGAACDMTAEQIAPTRNWARDYVVAPTFNSATAKFNHVVVASQDNTTIIITRSDGTQETVTLNARAFYRFATLSTAQLGYFLAGDKPIAVASNIGDPASNWDPSMVTWPPLDGYVSNAKMPTSGLTLSYTNFLTVITRTSATSYVKVNGVTVAPWTAIHTTGYSFARVPVPNGDNSIDATNGVKFAAIASGGANYVSYGYASPYDIASVGGSTNCYLGTTAPDYEAAFTGSAAANQDDLSATDDEDAFTYPTSVLLNAASPSLTVPCNDNYFGVDVTASVTGFIDFNQDGVFGAGEAATGGCVDNSPFTNGSATLTWSSPTYNALGNTMARFRICDSAANCSAATGSVASGEVEDHLVHIGKCGDAFVDTFDACDDGNNDAADGCSPTCTIESGFTCSGSPSVCLLNQAPTISSPANNALLNTSTPTISGACVTGATVRVREGTTTKCTATCAAAAYSCASSTLAEGSHALYAEQQVGAITSVPSATLTLRIDTIAPLAPAITSPTGGSYTNDATPDVSGTCEPGATVTIREGGTTLCTATCALAGTFTCTSSSLSNASHTLTPTQTDVGGNVSSAGGNVSITVDTVVPAAPTITAPAEGVDPNVATPTVSGACETGAEVRVVENLTNVLCTATCVASAYSCTTGPLSIGSHTIQARQYDLASNPSAFSTQRTFPITQLPIPAPSITAPTEGTLTNDGTPTITVSCVTGNTVNVLESGTPICSGTCAASSYTCSPALAEGAHAIRANQVQSGSTSPLTPVRNFTIDAQAPAAPTMTTPVAGSATTDTTPTIAGACETGATVKVTDGLTEVCSVTCTAGAYTCDSLALTEGSHTLVAKQTDVAGNTSVGSPGRTFAVDTTNPAAPVVLAPVTGSRVNDATPAVSGTCETGATVKVYESSTLLCTVTCAGGTFSCDSSSLSEAGHTVHATQTDPAGNVSVDSASATFTVDVTAPAVATITAPAQSSATNDNTPAVDGACEPSATVTVYESSTVLCSTTCTAGGTYTCSTSTLSDASHTIFVRQTDVAGNVSTPTANRTFTVDSTPPSAPPVSAPTEGQATNDTTPAFGGSCEAGATVRVYEGVAVLCSSPCVAGAYACSSTTVLGEGGHTVVVKQTDAVGNEGAGTTRNFTVDTTPPSAPTVATPTAGFSTNDNTPAFTGTCETGATVTLLEGASTLCTTTCTAGAYTCSTVTLGDGSHSVTVGQIDPAGNASSTLVRTFIVDTAAPAAPAITTPAASAPVSDVTPLFEGSCETNATVTVYEGSTVLCTSTCVAGAFSCESSTLGQGSHTAFARQTDVAGNVSVAGSNRTFTVDTVNPTAPVVTAPTSNQPLNDTTPDITGTCETGATVRVYEGASLLCTASCTAGAYTCNVSTPTEGLHTLTVRQTDPAGNDSPDTTIEFLIDITLPVAPAIIAPAEGFYSADATPTVSGTCETGATVYVREGSLVLCSATCVASAFSCESSSLSDASHQLTAYQVDPATNASANTGTRTFTVDTQITAPSITAPAAGAFVGTLTPTFTGACETGSVVTVRDGTTAVCNTTCTAGAYSCQTSTLTEGAHTLTVDQLDLANNQSTTTSVSITTDVTAPVAPSALAPVEGAFIQAQTVQVSGTCETFTTVAVMEGSTTLCSATCTAGAFQCTTPTLPEGAHTFVVRQTDRAGNASPDSAGRNVTFDVTAPVAAVITTPASGASTADSTPNFSGTCEASAQVKVSEGSTVLCTTTCTVVGTWSCNALHLTDGSHTASVVQTDRASNAGPAASVTFSVDSTVPMVPTVSAPASGAILSSATPTLSGTGEPGSTTLVYADGVEICTATVAVDGTWSCTASTLGEGTHHLQVSGRDALGNTSGLSATLTFSTDTVAPAVPSILLPTANETVSGSTSFRGRGEPGSRITVSVDGSIACTAFVDALGGWACMVSPALSTGSHTAVARAGDPAGNSSNPTDSLSFTVSATAKPGAPVILQPVARQVMPSATPQVRGRAEPLSTVTVSVDGVVVCTATTDASGDFQCTSSVTLPDGAHVLTARASNAQGAGQLTAEIPFTVDTAAPAAPAITRPAASAAVPAVVLYEGTAEAGATVKVFVAPAAGSSAECTAVADAQGHFACFGSTILGDGAYTATAVATDAAGHDSATSAGVAFTVQSSLPPSPPLIATPASGTQLRSGTVAFSGLAEPESEVQVLVDGTPVCTAVASSNGDWACTATGLTDGAHTVTGTVSNTRGASTTSQGTAFRVDTQAPSSPAFTSPTASGTTSPWPQFTGTAEPSSVVRVFVDGREVCVAIASSTGAFTCTAPVPFPAGAHQVTATATDTAGWTSTLSTSLSFTVNIHEPVLTSPASGTPVGTGTPTFTGTGEPGTTVTVVVNGTPVCQAVVDSSGNWSCTPTTPLPDGPKTVVITSDDGFGGKKTSGSTPFTTDTTPPAAPTVASPGSGEILLGGSVTFGGSAEPNSTVTVKVDGVTVCTAMTDAMGHWTCTASNLPGGTHQVTITARDAAGNVSVLGSSTFQNKTTLAEVTITSPGPEDRLVGPEITVHGTGTAGTTITVKDDAGNVVCTALVDANGEWECTGPLGAGSRSVSAQSSWNDLSSPESEAVGVTVLEKVQLRGGGCSAGGAGPLWAGLLLLAGLALPRRRARR